MKVFVKSLVLSAGLALTIGATAADAALIATIDGNDCAGEFGANFQECKIPAQYDLDQSPVIAKFNFSDTGDITSQQINTALFPSVDGSEFAVTFTMGTWMGTWTYTPGPGDPAVSFVVAKGGPSFNLFDALDDEWYTPENPGANRPGLSHITFYDTDGGGGDVPEPMSIALLGLGLLGIGFARRRR